YDAAGNLMSKVEQTWNQDWENFFQYQYAYDLNHNDTLQITQTWDAASSLWVNQNKYIYAFDANNNKIMFGSFDWGVNGNSWIPVFTNLYDFNANNLEVGESEQNWDAGSSAFINTYKEVFTYDANFNNTRYEDFSWDNGSATWVSHSVFNYQFDTYNHLVYELYQAYSPSGSAYVNTDQYFFYYNQPLIPTSINETKNDLQATIYPNPATGNELNLSLNLSTNGEIEVKTYDSEGRLISSETHSAPGGASNIQLNYNSGLSNGVYFLQLVDQNTRKETALKFIKE
ncbi:MAG: hypothetical protein JWO06_902, partial [Bacteroidota bacterium]|nr:hypothetical protein [Bacteroidota bacterium]